MRSKTEAAHHRLTTVGYVSLGGKPIDVSATPPPARPRPTKEREKQHLGFSPQGFPPGFIKQAEAEAIEQWERWRGLTEPERTERLKNGNLMPKPWDLAQWLSATKPQRIRARPFSIPSAAEECAAIARRSGWEHVRVVELVRG